MKIVNKHHNTMLGTMRVLSPVLALAMLFTLFGCAGDSPAPSASPVPSESIPTFSPEPDETEHQLTAEPTVMEPTASPNLTEAPTEAPIETKSVKRSRRVEFETAAKAILDGRMSVGDLDMSIPDFCDFGECYFGRLVGRSGYYPYCSACDVRITWKSHADGEEGYRWEYDEPFANFPIEAVEVGNLKVVNYLVEYLDLLPSSIVIQDGYSHGFGFAGEDWFLLKFEDCASMKHQNVHSIWRTDDGENFYEFGHNNSYIGEVTGACILSETTGFLCQTDCGYLDREHDGAIGFKVFGTFDGGETWQDMGLELTGEYAGYQHAVALAPTFVGDRGIILVGAFYNDRRVICCFTTSDGGRTWTFGS